MRVNDSNTDTIPAAKIAKKILCVYPGRDAVHFGYLWCQDLLMEMKSSNGTDTSAIE